MLGLRGTKESGVSRMQGCRRRRPLAAAAVSLLLVLMGFSPAALANEAAYGQRTWGSAILDGFKGNQGIRTNPATVTGASYAHPTQMDIGSPGMSFLAVGTYNGMGTSGGTTNCSNDYDINWSVYVDGEINGLYFCETVQADSYSAGSNPSFKIEYGFCNGMNRWLLSFGGTLWRCKSAGATGATIPSAGLETLGPNIPDRDIDVKYTNLQLNLVGFSSWISADMQEHAESPNYSFTYVSATAFNVFLAPLA